MKLTQSKQQSPVVWTKEQICLGHMTLQEVARWNQGVTWLRCGPHGSRRPFWTMLVMPPGEANLHSAPRRKHAEESRNLHQVPQIESDRRSDT